MDLLLLSLITIVGIFIGVVSVTVGSSGLITLPFLMSLGLSPIVAVATTRFAVLSSFVSGGIKYYQEGQIHSAKVAIISSILVLVGSLIGAQIVLELNEQILETIIVIMLVLILITVLFETKIEEKKRSENTVVGYVLIFILGVYAGFFAIGFGSFLIFVLVYFFGQNFLKSAALMTIINFFALIGSVVLFAFHGVLDYTIGIPLLIAIFVGGWIGAKFAVLKGNVWLKRLFIIVTVILILKIILGF